MMKAHVKTQLHADYTIDKIVSVTFSNGEICIVYIDEEGGINDMKYSHRSMGDEGSVIIS